MAALPSPAGDLAPRSAPIIQPPSPARAKSKQLPDISGVFRGRELTRHQRRLACGIAAIDRLIDGGFVRGRISEIVGPPGAGNTSLAAAFVARATARGEVAAWIDAGGGFDPASIAAAGVDLARMLWVAMPPNRDRPADRFDPDTRGLPCDYRRDAPRSAATITLKAAEWILTAGGFGLVVLDCSAMPTGRQRPHAFTQSAALRLAHGVERSGAVLIVIAPWRMCGTFAALSLTLSRRRACFSRTGGSAPALFDGLAIEARVTRNKLGGSGAAAIWNALADPPIASAPAASSPSFASATVSGNGRRAAAR